MPSGVTARLLTTTRVAVDAFVYALAVAIVAGLSSLTVGIATGGGFVRGKLLLFLLGWLILGYATIRLWPRSPGDAQRTPSRESIPERQDSTTFQSWIQALPPLRWMTPPPPDVRLTVASKLFLSGVLVLLASYLMESVYGVA